MGTKGQNQNTFASYEELPYLTVDQYSAPAYIYKRLDSELKKDIEDRTYYVGIPVYKNKNGKRISLRTPLRDIAIQKAESHVIDIRTKVAQGLKIKFTTTEKLVIEFLKYKKSLVRGKWDIKEDVGRNSITLQRYRLIESKLRNYFLPFIGADSNAMNLSYKKFDQEWRQWRRNNPCGRGQKSSIPKESTVIDEMGNIRELWKWGQMHGYITPSERKPFDSVDLIPNDEVRRDTLELSEWEYLHDGLGRWLIEENQKNPDNPSHNFDVFMTVMITKILARTGLRVGEAFKLKWKDIQFFKNEHNHGDVFNETGVLIQVHPSTKTGAREVNSDAGYGFFVIKDSYKEDLVSHNKDDFVFCHLDGSPITVPWFSGQFKKVREYCKIKEKTGKHLVPYSLRHFYATERIYAGVSYEVIADNMGIDSKRLKKSYKHSKVRMQQEELFKPVFIDAPNISPTSSDKEVPLGDFSNVDIMGSFEKHLKDD